MDLDVDAWTPMAVECMRCRTPVELRFYGMCPACTAELDDRFAPVRRDVDVAAYEPKVNVTPNAVATKE